MSYEHALLAAQQYAEKRKQRICSEFPQWSWTTKPFDVEEYGFASSDEGKKGVIVRAFTELIPFCKTRSCNASAYIVMGDGEEKYIRIEYRVSGGVMVCNELGKYGFNDEEFKCSVPFIVKKYKKGNYNIYATKLIKKRCVRYSL